MTSKSIELFKQAHDCDVTDDKQIDHAAKKCVAIGGLAFSDAR